MNAEIEDRLKALGEIHLSSGAHNNIENGYCAMELVAYAAGEPFSDHPNCVCPVIAAFLRNWNDSLKDDERNARRWWCLNTPEAQR